jgi:LDH2 family malate/lactate/ureidoglycolate dehydrogenase
MSSQPVQNGKDSKKRDPDLAAAETAMKRAARKAREKAKKVGAGVVIWKDGHLVEERLDTELAE